MRPSPLLLPPPSLGNIRSFFSIQLTQCMHLNIASSLIDYRQAGLVKECHFALMVGLWLDNERKPSSIGAPSPSLPGLRQSVSISQW